MAQAPQTSHPADVVSNRESVAQQHSEGWRRRKIIVGLSITLAVLILAFFAIRWWMYFSTHQETDDAYVAGHVDNVSSRVAGTVTRVAVDDNQFVRQGQLLVQLDPHDYEVAVQQAAATLALAQRQAAAAAVGVPEAAATWQSKAAQATGSVSGARSQIAAAQAGVAQAQAGVASARASVAQTKADLIRAQQDYRRYYTLERQGAVPAQTLDQAIQSVRVAQAQYAAAQDNLRAAQSKVTSAQLGVTEARSNLVATSGQVAAAQASKIQISAAAQQAKTAQAQVAQAQAQLRQAQLNLSYCNITAAHDGTVGNRTVELGERIQPGQALMAVVQPNAWIVANFKETQMEGIRPGNFVDVHIDAFPHHTFVGRVQGVAPGSGATFALLPPENATGNFTKIVQRIPVKIVLDPQSIRGFQGRIVPGMSCVVDVATR